MFPLNIKREIMNGLKQIFISYKVTDAKYFSINLGSMPVSLSSTFFQSMIQ
jgi:hypothetical protein